MGVNKYLQPFSVRTDAIASIISGLFYIPLPGPYWGLWHTVTPLQTFPQIIIHVAATDKKPRRAEKLINNRINDH